MSLHYYSLLQPPQLSTTSTFQHSLLFTFFCNAASKTYYKNFLALKQLKQGIAPDSLSPGSCGSSWDFSFDPCDSPFSDKFTCGFTCDVVSAAAAANNISRVTELALDQASYSASLFSISWNLPLLRCLDLTGNNFSGPLPDSLSKLTRLNKLTLSHNSLSGAIPDSLGLLPSLSPPHSPKFPHPFTLLQPLLCRFLPLLPRHPLLPSRQHHFHQCQF